PDEASAQYLRYDREGIYWTYVNAAIAKKVLRSYFGIRRLFKDEREHGTDEWMRDRSMSWEMTTEEFFSAGEIISVRFYTYEYLGGAHPNHYVETMNFLGSDRAA